MPTIEVFLNMDEKRVAPALQQAANDLDEATGEVVLDFSSLRRVDSRAARALEEFARAAEDKRIKIVLRGVNIEIYKLLKLLNLTNRFSFMN
jgi:anti-anti-sigma regulatory factor